MNITKEILFEYFFGRATTPQKKAVEEWLKKPEHENFYFECLEEWENTYPQYQPDAERALEAYKQFMQTNESPRQISENRQLTSLRGAFKPALRWYWMAASVMLVVFATALLWRSEYLFYQTFITSYGETKTILLEDQSQVVLNANSSLRVPRNLFASASREVWLTGEGFFNIARNATHRRFVVHTNRLNIEVLGTKFNVFDRRRNTRIVLEEGKVKVTPVKDSISVLMQPGELVETASATALPRKQKVKPDDFSAWRENKLIFQQTPLSEVLQTIEDYYGIDLLLEDVSLAEEQFTGVLPNDDLAVILRSLSRTYGFTIYREKEQIRLQ